MGRNYPKLRGKIIEKFGNQRNFCTLCEMSNTTLSYKLTGRRDFNTNDIKTISKLLEIKKNEIPDYFFADYVE